jgi:hypothetical protein
MVNAVASALALALLAAPAAHADEVGASPDLDGSGALSVQEIVHHWLSGDTDEARADDEHRKYTMEMAAGAVKNFDRDGDGELDAEEYNRFMDKLREDREASEEAGPQHGGGGGGGGGGGREYKEEAHEYSWGKSNKATDCGANNCYVLLNLPNPMLLEEGEEPATDRQIKKAYRKLSIKWHPDKCHDDEAGRKSRSSDLDCEATFKILANANEILSDPHRRAAYDIDMRRSYMPPMSMPLIFACTMIIASIVQYLVQTSTYEETISVLTTQPQFVTSVKQAAGIVGKGSSGSAALAAALREAAVAALAEDAEEMAAEAFTLWSKMKAAPEPSWAKTPLAGLLLLPYTGFQWFASAEERKKIEADQLAAEEAAVADKAEAASKLERKREEKLAARRCVGDIRFSGRRLLTNVSILFDSSWPKRCTLCPAGRALALLGWPLWLPPDGPSHLRCRTQPR